MHFAFLPQFSSQSLVCLKPSVELHHSWQSVLHLPAHLPAQTFLGHIMQTGGKGPFPMSGSFSKPKGELHWGLTFNLEGSDKFSMDPQEPAGKVV